MNYSKSQVLFMFLFSRARFSVFIDRPVKIQNKSGKKSLTLKFKAELSLIKHKMITYSSECSSSALCFTISPWRDFCVAAILSKLAELNGQWRRHSPFGSTNTLRCPFTSLAPQCICFCFSFLCFFYCCCCCSCSCTRDFRSIWLASRC